MNAQDARGADMNSIEDRIAAATRAAAQTVTPSSVPPLSLPAARGRRGWRWRGLAPVMAAVVVVVIILAAVVGRDVLSTGKAAPGPPAASPSSVAALVRSGQIPAFYVLLTRSSQPGAGPVAAVVHATATGRALATVKPTTGRTIVAASLAADDRTFVLDEEPWTAQGRAGQAPGTLVLVRLTSSGQAGSVTPLRMNVPDGASLYGMALSPDGSRIALLTNHDGSASQVTVVTLAGGASRSWSGPGNIGFLYDRAALSWTADQTRLAFTAESGPAAGEVRVLDLNRTSGSLLGDSTAVVSPGQQTAPDGTRVTWQGDAIITPDGATVVTGAPSISLASGPGKSRDTTGFAEFSARTGKVTRVIVPSTAGLRHPRAVLWSDRTGRVLIVEAEFSDSLRVGVLIGNKFTPLNLTWPLQDDAYSTW
jgi:hypothetical protein